MLIAISNMMMPPPTSSEPTEMPKNAMICCPSSAVTAITQNTEIDAMRIVLRFSNVRLLRGQAQEERDRADRIDQREQRNKRLE